MCDFENAAEHVPAIKSVEILSDVRSGVGTRFRETRVIFGKEASEVMEVTSFEPGRSYVVEAASCGQEYVTECRVEPDGTGCRAITTMHATPTTLTAKIVAPICGVIFGGMMKKALRGDLEAVGAVVTGG